MQVLPITFSEKDLNYIEARDQLSAQQTSTLKPDNKPKFENRGSIRSRLEIPPRETSDVLIRRNEEEERIKLQQWEETKETWRELSPEKGYNSPRDISLTLRSFLQVSGGAEAGWASFAASHRAQGRMSAERQIHDIRETGGYMQDPNRNYNRPDGPVGYSTQFTALRSGRRQPQARNSATFIPRTNSSHAGSSSGRREYGPRSSHVFDEASERRHNSNGKRANV